MAAVEAASQGVNWTFAPMIDISRDPRWGRIAESLGEDPYLASRLGAAMILVAVALLGWISAQMVEFAQQMFILPT